MATTLYETDFYSWIVRQADLLKNEDFAELDLPNLIEEIESMGVSQRSELDSRLTVLLMHLLKLTYQNYYPPEGWRNTVREQRRRLQRFLRINHTLRAQLAVFIKDAYEAAREDAAEETHLPLATFPLECPWTVDQILDLNWLP